MIRLLRRSACTFLLHVCGFLDSLPPDDRQYGCEIGISQWAVNHLDA